MKTPAIAARNVVRVLAPIQIVLGLVIWPGIADRLIGIHILIGIAIVLALWALAAIEARAGVSPGFVVGALVWGALTIVLGLTQESLVPGALHWTIQVLHLLVGLGAIGLAEALAKQTTSLAETEAAA